MIWHYYNLEQVEQASPGSHLGQWRLLSGAQSFAPTGTELSEWAADGLRFFRAPDSPGTTGRLVAYVRSDLSASAAAERMAERLGNVIL